MPVIVMFLLLATGFWQQQNIRDSIKLYGYQAPAPVVRLADDVDMTDSARRMFYVNHPELQDRAEFNSSCSSRGEQTIVLGCYHPVDRGIFLFHVGDPRLLGVEQVTAAHEMLHAGYDRLSRGERNRINGLLQDYYDTRLSDSRIKSVIDSYRKTEPNDVLNEMHSIFATESAELPAELEEYYKQYFGDRKKVVTFASTYQAEFATRQSRVAEYDRQLETMKQEIEINNQKLETQEFKITEYRRQMDSQRSSGDIAAYNANVPTYNRQVEAYNALISSTRTLIATYNQTVAVRNELALQVTELAHSIDSTYQDIQ